MLKEVTLEQLKETLEQWARVVESVLAAQQTVKDAETRSAQAQTEMEKARRITREATDRAKQETARAAQIVSTSERAAQEYMDHAGAKAERVLGQAMGEKKQIERDVAAQQRVLDGLRLQVATLQEELATKQTAIRKVRETTAALLRGQA